MRLHPPASIARGAPCPSPRDGHRLEEAGSAATEPAATGAIAGSPSTSSATDITPRATDPAARTAAIALSGTRRERTMLAPAFPEGDARPPEALAVWWDSRHRRRTLRGAEALGVPALLLGPGLLRAPPGWGKGPPLLCVTAQSLTGPGSPADVLNPDRLLMSCGWETSALLDRAAAARRQLAAGRVGGAWWNRTALPASGELAFVVADEPAPTSPTAVRQKMLEKMLAAALAENSAEKIVLLTSSRTCPRPLLAAAAARGCKIVDQPVDPWTVIERGRATLHRRRRDRVPRVDRRPRRALLRQFFLLGLGCDR